jgi:hypothetical protein
MLVLLFNREREPEYGGKKLSKWVRQYAIPNGYLRSPQGTIDAPMREMGTNAIPFLLEWIAYEQPAWKPKLEHVANEHYKFPGLRWLAADSREQLANGACAGFSRMGPKAEAAIPALAIMATNSFTNSNSERRAVRAIWALSGLGTNALSPILMAFKIQPSVRIYAAYRLPDLGSNALPAVPVLIQFLADKDPDLAKWAAVALGKLKIFPSLVVPALTTGLSDSRPGLRLKCARALGDLGPEANPAAEALLRLVNDPDPGVRRAVTNALQQLNRQSLKGADR